MQLKPHKLLNMLCRLPNTTPAMTSIGPIILYSTKNAVSEYSDDDKGIGKVALAKNLANLVEESPSYSTREATGDGKDDKVFEKMTLAQNLASLVQESYDIHERKPKPKTRVEMKRFLEMRIKKKVKEQYKDGKFYDLVAKVVANPNTLKDAYDCIRVTSNVDLAMDDDNLPFESMAEELAHGNFDVGANTYSISTKGTKMKEKLLFPKLNGRGHWSALKYIRKEIPNPDWWFTLLLNKKLDDCILTKLLSSIEDKIEDPVLCTIIRSMYDAKVLNMEFGGFPKGHGLPQEGLLAPILMNIYLDLFDHEIYRMSMRYEASDSSCNEKDKSHSNLRGWFRRQISGNSENNVGVESGVRVHCCRFMDEIFFAISGPKEVALSFKSETEGYLRNSLFLELDNQSDVLACNGPSGVQFLGTFVKRRIKETTAVRTVHKLKEKVKLFSEQKQESWDSGAVRIGKKWLAHGLKKVKESEIKHLADRPTTLYSTKNAVSEYSDDDKGIGKVALAKNLANLVEEGFPKTTLAQNLASLVQESNDIHERKPKPKTCVEMKRFLEMRIKKKVKEQYRDGKFYDLMEKVISDPNTLKDAYDCIRVTSNVDLAMDGDNLTFDSIAEELAHGNFDVGANTYSISTKGTKMKEKLLFPKLKLRVVQEAIRIALEVVYRPHFSKISHGLRSGRSHWSALKYIRKEIPNPDWWFTLLLNKKLDDCILTKLLSSIEDKIEDPVLCTIIGSMYDAKVLNMEFGGLPKGHGLPQEGVLAPILMNIYLDLFDHEIYRMSMKYEASDSSCNEEDKSHSKLRGWFRRQISGNNENNVGVESGVRVHCCRFMDEIFFAISGPKEVALSFKSETEGYLRNSLFLELDNQSDVLACNGPSGVQFLGTFVKRRVKETTAVRTVHKLKEKVKLFSEQKQESWDSGAVRIGKKCLAHGLKKVKESEIKHLADSSSVLNQISSYRKSGMETDHWYKLLLKIWMQDLNANAKSAVCEETILAKYITEPALPRELRDAYYEIQKCANEYISSETASTLALLPCSSSSNCFVTEIIAPVNMIKKRLNRYGLTNREGFACTCHALILLDDNQIFNWFSGIVQRLIRWYKECDNFNEVKLVISNQVRMSCIRTLAAKYRIHEGEIEKKFDSELCKIPSTEDIEIEEVNEEIVSQDSTFDVYGINYSGLCLVSLARMVSQSRPCYCFVVGCSTKVLCVYTLQVMERQKFPTWKTGFSSSIHPSLHRRRIGLCKQHVMDLFLGNISLQSIDFGAWR
ncbi:hypothetical protein ACJIZ3_023896 [Penstemon smallii]|uniref:Domain X domain-containing protein n=1 Tax=Penstemon smallii TaxID=265156 RepID=A0ABD3TSN5_9LAMI